MIQPNCSLETRLGKERGPTVNANCLYRGAQSRPTAAQKDAVQSNQPVGGEMGTMVVVNYVVVPTRLGQTANLKG